MNVIVGSPAWTAVDRPIGMPSSCAIVAAISSLRAARPAAIARIRFARSTSGVCDHDSKAARAACTARSTSSGVPCGIRPITSSVDAFTTSIVSDPAGSTHLPPMKSLSRT